MARLYQSGFELQSAVAGTEFTNNGLTGASAIDTTIKRSGAASLKISPAANNSWIAHRFVAGTIATDIYSRVYIYITVLPAATQVPFILSMFDLDGSSKGGGIILNSDGTLTLNDRLRAQIGSATAALSLNKWYCLELYVKQSATTLTAKLDGVQFATSTSVASTDLYNAVMLGEPSNSYTWTVYFDDWAINDISGSFQKSWCNEGHIVHLKPNATGDSNQWLNTVGGAGAGTDWGLVDEITPNDATDFINTTTLNDVDLFKCETPSFGASTKINTVLIGARFRNDVADAVGAFIVEVEKVTGGTKAVSSNIIPNSVTWKTNNLITAKAYPVVTYQDPDAVNWSLATLSTMQIGVKYTVDGAQKIQVTTLWASVDYSLQGSFFPMF